VNVKICGNYQQTKSLKHVLNEIMRQPTSRGVRTAWILFKNEPQLNTETNQVNKDTV